jgi:hypothetical protein
MHASERDTPRVQAERLHYRDLSAALDLRRVKFIDESGINIAMTRLYGRAPRGERALGSAPQNYGPNVTILGALSCTGLGAVLTLEGATAADVFRAYVREVLCPTLREGDIVIADKLSAHKAAGVQEAIAAQGARLLYLPPYSPDLNPMSGAGQRSRRACVPLRRARARRLTRRSRGRWQPSRRRMHGHGSPIAAMFYTKLKIALVYEGSLMARIMATDEAREDLHTFPLGED